MAETVKPSNPAAAPPPGEDDLMAPFSSAEVGAIAHLYRGEIYRSTIWRTRLDATTNWSVVSLGIALSIAYASPQASALPLALVSLLIFVFLYLEARRYRYFNVWRARARWIEVNFYAPLLRRRRYENGEWQATLAADYEVPEHHITFGRAFGRRLRRNYLWIFLVQGLAFAGKIVIHPTPLESTQDAFDRLAMGPVPGWFVSLFFLGLYGSLLMFTLSVFLSDRRRLRDRPNPISMG